MKPNKEKIDFLNSNTHHLLLDYETDGVTCAEVVVLLTAGVEDVLKSVGVDEQWISNNRIKQNDHEYAIDLTHAGFDRCGAKWWHPDHGFMTHKFE